MLPSSFLLLGRPHAGTWWLTLQLALGVMLGVYTWQAIVSARGERTASSGIDEARLLVIPWMQVPGGHDLGSAAVLSTLRNVPGVASASAANQAPFGKSAWSAHLWTGNDDARRDLVSVYMADEAFLSTLGVAPSRGRRFATDEYQDYTGDRERLLGDPAPALVSSALAQRLYGTTEVLGRSPRLFPGKRLRIVGVIDQLPLPATAHQPDGAALVLPMRMTRADGVHFLVRHAGDADAVAARLHAALTTAYPDALIAPPAALATLRSQASREFMLHAGAALAACLSWWLLTLGMLMLFGERWIEEHRQEISLRRAFGATALQLAHRLRGEYLVLASMASLLGIVSASLVPRVLPSWLPSMPSPWLLVIALVATAAVVQLAATWPIRVAGHVAPHLVSRSPSVRL